MAKQISSRFAVSVIVGILLAIAGGSMLYVRLHTPRTMTLAEALWVCTPDMKTYFPPGSPESAAMVQTVSHGIDTNTFRTPHFLCARIGFGTDLSASEPIMWEIHPEQIPNNAVERARTSARRSP